MHSKFSPHQTTPLGRSSTPSRHHAHETGTPDRRRKIYVDECSTPPTGQKRKTPETPVVDLTSDSEDEAMSRFFTFHKGRKVVCVITFEGEAATLMRIATERYSYVTMKKLFIDLGLESLLHCSSGFFKLIIEYVLNERTGERKEIASDKDLEEFMETFNGAVAHLFVRRVPLLGTNKLDGTPNGRAIQLRNRDSSVGQTYGSDIVLHVELKGVRTMVLDESYMKFFGLITFRREIINLFIKAFVDHLCDFFLLSMDYWDAQHEFTNSIISDGCVDEFIRYYAGKEVSFKATLGTESTLIPSPPKPLLENSEGQKDELMNSLEIEQTIADIREKMKGKAMKTDVVEKGSPRATRAAKLKIDKGYYKRHGSGVQCKTCGEYGHRKGSRFCIQSPNFVGDSSKRLDFEPGDGASKN